MKKKLLELSIATPVAILLVRYASRVVIYDCRAVIRLATEIINNIYVYKTLLMVNFVEKMKKTGNRPVWRAVASDTKIRDSILVRFNNSLVNE